MSVISRFNDIMWSGPLLILLLGIHIYFTISTKFVQKNLKKGIRYSLEKESGNGMSAFGTLTTTLAATLGTGNIIGVSTAVSLGGAGAVFWCWITGFLGMATAYAETYLSCCYREKDENGRMTGGPMYVLKNALGKPKLAFMYCFFICLSAFFAGCQTQSNAISETCLDVWGIPKWLAGIVAAMAVGLVILQGATWIEHVCMRLVPFMTALFIGGCLLFIGFHGTLLKEAVFEVVKSAFNTRSFFGGTIGFSVGKAVRYGVARGLFTNEAGLGTAGIAGASGSENVSPHRQALVSMTAAFWDTVVMCAITGIVIVMYVIKTGEESTVLMPGLLIKGAFASLPLPGEEMFAVTTISFAAATLIGWSYFGQVAADFMGGTSLVKKYQYVYVVMIFAGAVLPMGTVWEMADFINFFILIPAVYALVRCRKKLGKPPSE